MISFYTITSDSIQMRNDEEWWGIDISFIALFNLFIII